MTLPNNNKADIRVYGAARCHKTQYYLKFFKERDFAVTFLDVEQNADFAEELRGLYENRKLNFPTIMIKDKKLRNPSDKDLKKWLAKKMGKQNFVLGLGTAAIGRPQYINIRQEDTTDFSLTAFRAAGKKVLDLAYEKGIRYFDTAPGYGLAEELLVKWAQGKNDATIELATKWGYTYVANFAPNATIHEVKEHSLEKLNEQWAFSKKALPYLQTYQIHSATFETGVLDNEKVLNRLAELKVNHNLHIGITTTGANQVEVLKKALEVVVNGIDLFDAFQVTYNILDQSLLEISELLTNTKKRIIIKEALANGRIFPNKRYPNYHKLYQVLASLAKKYQVGIDAIALRFCIDSIAPFKVLSGASKAFHFTENLKAESVKLMESDIARLRQFAILSSSYWKERKQLDWN